VIRCYACPTVIKKGELGWFPHFKLHGIRMCRACYIVALAHSAHLSSLPSPGWGRVPLSLLKHRLPGQLTPSRLRGSRHRRLAVVALLLGTTYTNLLRALRLVRSIQRSSADLRRLTVQLQVDNRSPTVPLLSIAKEKKARAASQSRQ
jgi:hypothetical protein